MKIVILNKRIDLKIQVVIFGAIIAVIFLAVTGYMISKRNTPIIIEQKGAPAQNTQDPLELLDAASEDTVILSENTKEQSHIKENTANGVSQGEDIYIYVVGCVNNPGVVSIKKGMMIKDAIDAAGGFTEDADMENINLVYRLYDNVMIKVKSIYSSEQNESMGLGNPGNRNTVSGYEIITDSNGVIEETAENLQSSGSKEPAKININTASIEELDTLPGIGAQTAKDIIEYRNKNGFFKTIDEIMKVPGIKENKFSKIKDYICVD